MLWQLLRCTNVNAAVGETSNLACDFDLSDFDLSDVSVPYSRSLTFALNEINISFRQENM